MSFKISFGEYSPKDIMSQENKSTISITFAERAENSVGMQVIGKEIPRGLSPTQLKLLQKEFKNTELIDLLETLPKEEVAEEACVLIIRDFLSQIGVNDKKVFNEVIDLEWDKKKYMVRHKKVVNSRARYNLCVSDFSQQPDYENRKGRIINFDTLPYLNQIRYILMDLLNVDFKLQAELNNYYDVNKCSIGFHSDLERKIVTCLRLGEPMAMHFNWFKNSTPIGTRTSFTLNSGDLYLMSEKAVGNDGKMRKRPTLRHAAGCEKYTKLPVKKKKKNAVKKVEEKKEKIEEKKGEIATCSICIEKLSDKQEENKTTNCDHVFHKACLDEWLKRKNVCPICRYSQSRKKKARRRNKKGVCKEGYMINPKTNRQIKINGTTWKKMVKEGIITV